MHRSDRFAFGENWQSFLRRFTPSRLDDATQSLHDLLGRSRLDGVSFLDAGSGTGLFSAAVLGLGARVVSFDYDHVSVEATRTLEVRRVARRFRGMSVDDRQTCGAYVLQQKPDA